MKHTVRMNAAAILFCAFAAVQFVFAEDSAAADSASAVNAEAVAEIIAEDTSAAEIKAEAGADTAATGNIAVDKSESTETVEGAIENAIGDIYADFFCEGVVSAKKQKSQNTAIPDNESNKTSAKAKKDETTFKLSGYAENGFDINNRVNEGRTESRIISRGELEISARPVKKVRAEIGIEYDLRDYFTASDASNGRDVGPVITMDKFYGQYGITDNGTIRAGIMKKSFGLEERAGLTERYFHRRSIINSGLSDLGFLDHDLTLMYRHEVDKQWRLAAGFSWSVADSLRYLQNYSAQYNMNDDFTIILAAIIRHYDIPEDIGTMFWIDGVSTTFVTSLSARYAIDHLISEAEITFGTNPEIKIKGRGRDAFILGIRAQEQFPVNVKSKILRQIIPLAEFAFYWDDMESGNHDAQFRGGVTLGFAKNSAFQFRNTYGTILRTRDGKTEVRRHRFDSEIIVIF